MPRGAPLQNEIAPKVFNSTHTSLVWFASTTSEFKTEASTKSPSPSEQQAWAFRSKKYHQAKVGHGEVRVYRGTGVSSGVRRTTWERSLKRWELQIPRCKEFLWEDTLWDLNLPVALTLWDTPVLCTPPLPFSQQSEMRNEKLITTKKLSPVATN